MLIFWESAMKLLKVFGIILACSAGSVHANLITNGDFSSGLTGWTATNAGSGAWYSDTVGTTTPNSLHTTSGAGGGVGTYAVTDQGGPGTLWSTLSLPGQVLRHAR